MRYVTVTMILAIALFLFAGCPGVEKPPAQTGDAVVNWSIKKAMSAESPKDYLALYTGNPVLKEDMHEEERQLILAGVRGEVNGNDIDLSRIRDIKLAPVSYNTANSYEVRGTFSYSGRGVVGSTKVEVPDGGTGTIFAWAKQDKDGSWYLNKLSIELDTKTRIAALRTSKKAGR